MPSLKTNHFLKIVFCLLTFSTLFGTSKAYSSILISKDDNDSVATCILNIVQKYVNCNSFISVVVSGTEYSSDVIEKLNEDICYSVTLKSSDENHWLIWTETYLILPVTADDLTIIFSQLSNDLHWNPRARFIILTDETRENQLKSMFQTLLERHIYNVIMLTLYDSDVFVYTYFPFGNGRCGRSFEDLINFGECSNAVNSEVLFSNKYVDDNMKNCTVNLILHEDIPSVIPKSSEFTVFNQYVPGMEQYMLATIGYRENFTYRYKWLTADEKIGFTFENRTVTGVFINLQDGTVDMVVGGLILTRNRAALFDYIWGYNYERLSLYTPVLQNRSWKNIFKTLSPQAWACIVVCYFLIFFISLSAASLYPDVVRKRLQLVFTLWGIFFDGSADKSLLKVRRIRILLCCWMWLTFFVINFYNTALFSLITSQAGNKGSFDIEDLDHLPFKPCISDNMRALFISAYNQILPESVPSPNCRSISSSLTEVSRRTDLYTIGIKQNYKLRAYEFVNFRGQSTIDVWDFSNACVPVIYVKKGHPLKEKIETYARYMYEGGLMQKHFDFLSLRSHSAIMRKSNSFVRVRLQYLQYHFMLLGVGILASIVVFFSELIVMKLSPNMS